MQRTDSLKKTLMLGKVEGQRRRGKQRMRWLEGITDSMDMGLGGLPAREKLVVMSTSRLFYHCKILQNTSNCVMIYYRRCDSKSLEHL